MANELQAFTVSGLDLYCVLLDTTGKIWNGAGFVPINAVNWTNYDIIMTEATAGIYLATMPSVNAGQYNYISYERIGGAPAITDTLTGIGIISWNGDAVLDIVDEICNKCFKRKPC